MPRKQKKYHFIYKTTNLLNDKFYVGMHSTDNLEDGYVGSGKRLRYSINKYGIENHKFEILEFLPSREELKKREVEVVNEELLTDPLCMNLKFGGEGGWDHLVKDDRYYEQRKNNGKSTGASNGRKTLSTLREEKPEFMTEISSKAGKIGGKTGKLNVIHMNTPEVNDRRKARFKDIGHSVGEKNSQFGTCWIFHELVGNKKCDKNLLPLFLDQGWIKGRK